jgi:sulfonate transport system permease protein
MILDAEQMSRPDVVLVGLFSIGILGGLINKVFPQINTAFTALAEQGGR